MTTPRGQILETARTLTEGDRNAAYGDPKLQLALAGELKLLCNYYRGQLPTRRTIGEAEMEALHMCLGKISRIMMGGTTKRDNYIDLAAYAAIAGECANANER